MLYLVNLSLRATDGYRIFSYSLETDGNSSVEALLYLPNLRRVACALSNGRLFLLNSESLPRTPTAAEGSFVMTELCSNNVIYCLCAFYTDDRRYVSLLITRKQEILSFFFGFLERANCGADNQWHKYQFII